MIKNKIIVKIKKITVILTVFSIIINLLPNESLAQSSSLSAIITPIIQESSVNNIETPFAEIDSNSFYSLLDSTDQAVLEALNTGKQIISPNFIKPTKIKPFKNKNLKADESAIVVLENAKEADVDLKVFDFNGQKVNFATEVVSSADPFVIKINPSIQSKPGRYRIKITDAQNQVFTQEFTWGVLAINTNKSIYSQNEIAHFQMAVLDDTGEMVCNSNMVLKISSPKKEEIILTTADGTIIVNPECYSKEFTIIPDYQASYQLAEKGIYSVELTATTPDGSYTINDVIEVSDSNAFSIERIAPTRIYPPLIYPVRLKITAKEDFTGVVKDYAPASFNIIKNEEAGVVDFDTIETRNANSERNVLGAEVYAIGKPFEGDFGLTLGFGGQHRDPKVITKYTQFGVLGHDGVDFALPMNSPVIAVDDGEIVKAQENGDYGTTIVIKHVWGKSYYGHLSKIVTPLGEKVKKGDLIALSGNSGLSSGPHLHFGIKPDKNDFDNGFYGKINPLPYLGIADTNIKHGQVAGVSTPTQDELQNGIKVISWNVSVKKGETIELGYKYDAPDISPEFYLLGYAEIYENNTKVFSEMRHWQIASDAVVVNGGIVTSEAQFGGLQRKVAYVNSNWYAFYNDGTDVFWKKSSDGITWGSANNLDANEDNDADNYNPSISVNGTQINVAYFDDSGDQIEILTLNTADDTTTQTTTPCRLTSPGTLSASTYMVSIAGDLVVYSDTSSGTYFGAFDVDSLTSSSCTTNIVQPGGTVFGSGLTAGDRPVAIQISTTKFLIAYTDGSNLKSAIYRPFELGWDENGQVIAAIADSTYSLATDGTTVWVLTQNGSTATRLYSCCTADLATTTIDTDIASDGTDIDADVTDVDMFCPTEDNCKIVYTDDMDTAAPKLKFIDCNDSACSTPVVSTLIADLGDAGDNAGASIYCVSDGSPTDGSDNCKVITADLLGANSTDVSFIDCNNDEDCSTNTITDVNTDIATGNDTVVGFHSDIYCPTDTNCKFVFNDELAQDVTFVDCPDATCTATGRVITDLDTDYGNAGNGTNANAGPWVKLYCVASDNCKIVYHDNDAVGGCADANSLCFVDCTADEDCSTNTQTVLDTDAGVDQGGTNMDIDCVGGDTECSVVYNDGTDADLTFIDCEGSATCATGSTVTDIDTQSSVSWMFFKLSMDCPTNGDCKIFYISSTNTHEASFVDCDNETCTSGNTTFVSDPGDSASNSEGGAISCLTSTNCKMTYANSVASATQPLIFVDCDTEDCMPTWSSLTAPWISETNVISISLTYDSTNSDLIANIIKDASELAYYKISDAASISWGSEIAYEFTAGDLDNISSPETAAGTDQMGVLLRQGSNIEFDLLSAALSGPTLEQTMRHGKYFSGGVEMPFTF